MGGQRWEALGVAHSILQFCSLCALISDQDCQMFIPVYHTKVINYL